jgi:DUF177 domain-containing protein
MLSYNVADLLRSAPGTSERHEVSVETLPLSEDLELAAPVTGEVRLINAGRSIIVQGHLETALAEQCSRCLRPARAALVVELEEEVLPSVDLETGVPLDRSEEPDVLRLTDHHELDLDQPLREAISLAEPIAPLCRPDCPGLCETCGLDLSDHPAHRHADDEIDPRLAVLAELRD